MTIHVSLERADLNSLNVSAPDFDIWQHIGSNWSTNSHSETSRCAGDPCHTALQTPDWPE